VEFCIGGARKIEELGCEVVLLHRVVYSKADWSQSVRKRSGLLNSVAPTSLGGSFVARPGKIGRHAAALPAVNRFHSPATNKISKPVRACAYMFDRAGRVISRRWRRIVRHLCSCWCLSRVLEWTEAANTVTICPTGVDELIATRATAKPCGLAMSSASLESEPLDQLICIATVALHKARERGFAPGYERQDWLEAKAEVLAQMYGLTGAGF